MRIGVGVLRFLLFSPASIAYLPRYRDRGCCVIGHASQ